MKARRLTLKILSAAVFAVALMGAYLHFGLFPGNLKNYVVKKMESLSGRRVVFDKTVYLPFKGLTFHDLRVTDPAGRVLFSAKRVSINAKLWAFLFEQKIIITQVSLDTPVYDLALSGSKPPPPPPPKTKISGQIDVPVLPTNDLVNFKSLEYGPDTLLPENVYLERIHVTDGILLVRDKATGPITEVIHGINLDMDFEKPPVLRFNGSLKLGKITYGHVELTGRWDLDKAAYEFRLTAQSDKIPAWLAEYQKKNFIRILEGRVGVEASLRSINEKNVLFHAEFDLGDAAIAAHGARYSGQMAADADGLFNFDRRKFDRYKGTLHFVDVRADHFSKTFDKLENISGKLNFKPDILEINAIRGQFRDTVFEAEGAIRSFKDLNLDASVSVESNVAAILRLLPEDKRSAVRGYEFDGDCKAVTFLKGSLKNPQNLVTTHRLVISDGSIKNAEKKLALEEVSGEFEIEKTSVGIQRGRFLTGGKAYVMSGVVPFLPDKPGNLQLETKGLKLTAAYTTKNGAISISKAHLAVPGVNASFHGVVSDLSRSRLEARGEAVVVLERAASLFGPSAKTVEDAGLKGTVKGPFILKGAWNEPAYWDLQFDGKSPVVFIKEKFRFDNFQIQLRMKNRILNIPFLRAEPFGGVLGGRVLFDLRGPQPSFDAKIYANGVDLKKMVPILDPKHKDLKGTLIVDIDLRGIAGKQESFTGKGMMDIRNGYLWKSDLFKKMGELPFVKVIGLNEVVFTSANGTFTIAHKKLSTSDLNLLSDTVDLKFKGDVGFDGKLDLAMFIRYSSNVFRGALDTGGIVPFVLEQAEQLISQYKIGGTLTKPTFDKSFVPPVQNVGKTLGGIVQDVV